MRAAAQRVWRLIDESTVRRPLATKLVLSTCLTFVADAVVQTAVERRGYDTERAGKIVAWRCLIHTPFAHWWFNALDRAFGAAAAPKIVFRKLLADQLLASPAIHFLFFHFMARLEGKGHEEAMAKIHAAFLPLIYGSWVYWGFVNGTGFYVVPLRHRVLWASCGGMVWMGILSAVNQRANDAPSPADAAPGSGGARGRCECLGATSTSAAA